MARRRFGRNQKRKLKEQVAAAERAAESAQGETAHYRKSHALLQRIINHIRAIAPESVLLPARVVNRDFFVSSRDENLYGDYAHRTPMLGRIMRRVATPASVVSYDDAVPMAQCYAIEKELSNIYLKIDDVDWSTEPVMHMHIKVEGTAVSSYAVSLEYLERYGIQFIKDEIIPVLLENLEQHMNKRIEHGDKVWKKIIKGS